MTENQPSDVREVFNDDRGAGYDPLFPFGWGLSYTQFEYSDLHLSSNKLAATGKLTVRVTVKNTGSRDGRHTIELYTHEHYSSITPNMRRLRAFQKIFLKAGESKTVSFTLDKNDLAFVNAELHTVTEPGDFDVLIGDKKGGLYLRSDGGSITPFLHHFQIGFRTIERRFALVGFLFDDKITRTT